MKTLIAGCGVLTALAISLLFCLPGKGAARPESRLIVHEWGTFTALQDDDGTAIGGLNIDDEPLPNFVHYLRRDLLRDPLEPIAEASKGLSVRHPAVTMRLETPVLYFYPPPGQQLPLELDVHVDFRGGWLSEFYPHAESHAPGLNLPPNAATLEDLARQRPAVADGDDATRSDPAGAAPSTSTLVDGEGRKVTLGKHTIGSLDWRSVAVGTETAGPETDSHVWLAPRQVQAASVTTPPYVDENDRSMPAESEKYLFYRGVGHLDAPLRVVSSPDEDEIELKANLAGLPGEARPTSIGPLWLVEVRADRTAAFRQLAEFGVADNTDQVLASARRTFDDGEFSTAAIDRLCDSMHVALVRSGLYDDEATAMLETWKQSYFLSPGLRLFFLVPRSWTDHILPLTISHPAEIERVMMARIELVSAEQRRLLAQLHKPSAVERDGGIRFERVAKAIKLVTPPEMQGYLDLGRFRRPLLTTELQKRPSKNLSSFVRTHQINE